MTKEQFKKKWDNYWFYHKIHTIVAVFAIVVVAVLIQQCASRISPDMTVLFVSQKVALTDSQKQGIEKKLEKYTADLNGDGRKVVSLDTYYMDPKQGGNMLYVMTERLTATLSASDTTLYITDDHYYKYVKGKKLFFNYTNLGKTAPDTTRIKLSSLPDFKIKGASSLYNNLTLSFRQFGDSYAKTYKNSSNYRNSISVLEKILKSGGLIK